MVRLVAVTWWFQLKIRSTSAFDGVLSLLWPLFFATTIFLMYRSGSASGDTLITTAIGASMMGVWSATSTTAAFALQLERRQGTLELLVAAPAPFSLLIIPVTLSMATIGVYSMVATLLWGRFVFGIDITVDDPLMFAAAVLVTVISIGMLGFVIAIGSVRYRSAWALGAALEIPVWLVCGFLVSVSALPGWVRPISWLLAPTWGMSAVRAATQGGNALPDIAVCAALAVAYGVLGVLLSHVLVHSARARATLALT
jgi:ABC-2 type transport system permease protein